MFDRITTVVKYLLIINVVIFFGLGSQNIANYFPYYNPVLPNNEEMWNPNFKPWQLITYMFMHAGPGHLFNNMLGLFFFGSTLETYMGSRKFLMYYLLCGVGSALFYSLINYYELSQIPIDSQEYLMGAITPMVGASGAIFGILVAFAYLFPEVEMMMLFIPFPIKAKYFVTMYGVFELVQGVSRSNSGIAHFAHVGGLVVGFILLKFVGFDKRFYKY